MANNRWTKDQAMSYLAKWCAEQERSHFDTRSKLIAHQVYGEDLENVIAFLISEGFLNEERFAKAYASGKVKINRWGINKVRQGLKQKQVSEYCIKKAMASLDESVILENVHHLISKKAPLIKSSNAYEWKRKMSAYMTQKGYHYEDFNELLDQYYQDVK